MVKKGEHLSSDHKRKIGLANKGKRLGLPSPNKGKKASKETIERLRKLHLGIPLSKIHRRNIGLANLGKKHPPRTEESKEKQRLAMTGRPSPFKGKIRWTPEQRKQMGDKQRGRKLSEEHKKKISKGNKGRVFDQETRLKISNTLMGHPVSQEQIEKQRQKLIGKKMSDLHRIRTTEALLGGFWYGNVRYSDYPLYCELWTPEFRERVRAFFDFKCVECGTPQNGKRYNVHHVHYDKKVCCKKNEEVGDRKFVLLCKSCHTKTNFNREFWEKHFTDMINGYYQGKCYFTKDEIKINNTLLYH